MSIDNTLPAADDSARPARLAHFPVSFFAIVMGLSGLSIAWFRALSAHGSYPVVAGLIGLLAALVFLTAAGLYLTKLVSHRSHVAAELIHPIKSNFFAAMPISLLLLAVVSLPLSPTLSRLIWMIGAAAQLGVLLFVVNAWLHQPRFKVEHLNPAWFIPAVGNILVPLAGISHGFVEVSWFFFSIGMLFWIVLLTIVFNRILFHAPLPQKLLPTLFILIAPPSIGTIAWVSLNGEFDPLAHGLYGIGLFFTLLMLTQAARFIRLPFFLSSWAYSFPLTAIATASFLAHESTGVIGYRWVAYALLALASAVILWLTIRTAMAVANGQICVPE